VTHDAATPTTARAQAILRHPDQESAWSVVVAASLHDRLEPDAARERLEALSGVVPAVRARLVKNMWVVGLLPEVVVVAGDPLSSSLVRSHYALDAEPPLRVVVGDGGRRVAIVGHHAAFDGLGLVAILAALTGGPFPEIPQDVARPGPRSRAQALALIARVARPADRVASSSPPPGEECFVARDVVVSGRHFTANLADACVRAVSVRNATFKRPWKRVALSIGVGGAPGVGNTASYRRVDVSPGSDVAAAVDAALRDPAEPRELLRPPRAAQWLRRLAPRLSDSLLVSNVGCQPIPSVSRLEFFPVARGRSGVAVGAGGVSPGHATVTMRANRLSPLHAEELLSEIVAHL
jgi:hypothetical protein